MRKEREKTAVATNDLGDSADLTVGIAWVFAFG